MVSELGVIQGTCHTLRVWLPPPPYLPNTHSPFAVLQERAVALATRHRLTLLQVCVCVCLCWGGGEACVALAIVIG